MDPTTSAWPTSAARAARRGRRTVALGVQQVLAVRIGLTHGRPVATVIGVARRRPVVQRISMATATELAAAGVPVTAERDLLRAAACDATATPIRTGSC